MILFKDVKQGYPIIILDKENFKLSFSKVISVGFSRYDSKTNQNVIDIVLELDGKNANYVIPDNLSVAYFNNMNTVLSTEREVIINEITSARNNAERILQSVPHQEEVLKKSEALLEELNPSIKKDRETEERFNKIESVLSELTQSMNSLVKELKG